MPSYSPGGFSGRQGDPGAEIAGESLQILAEATPVVHDVQGEAQPVLQTLEMGRRWFSWERRRTHLRLPGAP